jgi:hypothetical protein
MPEGYGLNGLSWRFSFERAILAHANRGIKMNRGDAGDRRPAGENRIKRLKSMSYIKKPGVIKLCFARRSSGCLSLTLD